MKLGVRLTLALIVLVTAAVAKDYSATGPFDVSVADDTLYDPARNNGIPVRVYFPESRVGAPAPQKFPVIVFSHGAGASRETYQNWGRHWASYGYVSIHPTHDDSLELQRSRGQRANMRGAVRTAMRDEDAWRERPRDISFVLDCLDSGELERCIPALKGKLDRERIGVGGHSFGAYTAQAIGGAVSRIGNFGDPRVRAVVLMSPQGRNQMSMTADSWKSFTIPAMILTGPRDAGRGGHDPLWRKDPFQMSPPGDKYFVWVEGASHFTFVGNERRGLLGSSPEQVAAIKATTTAFWESYLRKDAAARQALALGEFMPQPDGVVRVDQR